MAKKAAKKTAKKIAKKAPDKKAAAPKAKKSKTETVYKLEEGAQAPSIAAPATSGRAITDQTYKGKTVILYFYPKDNTPGCTLEGQDFRRLYSQFQKAGAEILGVSQDSIASHERFKTKCDFPFELLSDESGSLSKDFDVMQMKSMYGREFMGIERSTFVLKGGVLKKAWRKVKVNGHAQEVLDYVKTL